MPDDGTPAPRLRYAVGEGRLVAVGQLVALLPAGGGSDLVEALWALPSTEPVGVAAALLGSGSGLPEDLAVAVLSGGTATVLLRGRGMAQSAAGAWGADGARTWRELELPAEGLVLTLGTAEAEPTLPLAGGVVSASAVRWGLLSEPVVMQPAVRDAEPDLAVDPMPMTAVPTEATAATDGAATLSETLRPDELLPSMPAAAPASVDDAAPIVDGRHQVAPDDRIEAIEATEDDSYDRLFGATEHVGRRSAGTSTVGAEPPPREAPEAPPAGGGAEVERSGGPVAHEPATSTTSGGMVTSVPLISSVPGAQGPTPDPADPQLLPPSQPVQVPPADASEALSWAALDDDVSGMTVARSALSSMRAAPQVHGVTCPRGHANPVEAVVCRVCGTEVPAQAAITLARPPLGALVAVDVPPGAPARVELDGPLLLGRRPTLDGQSGPVPTLVTVASPDHDLSRNHLRVNLDGWHVLVTDLGSTNGTVVALPGEQPERIHPQRPTMITPGTRITLADVATYVYEVTA